MPDTVFVRPIFTLLPELVKYAAYLRGFEPELLTDRIKHREISWTRFGVIWAIRQVMKDIYSYPLLARRLGFKDHTSVLHGYRRAETLRDSDFRFKLFTDRLLAFAKSRCGMAEEVAA